MKVKTKQQKVYICRACEKYPVNPLTHKCGYKYLQEIGEYLKENE